MGTQSSTFANVEAPIDVDVVRLPKRRRPAAPTVFKKQRRAARAFVRLQVRRGLRYAARRATATLRLEGWARNRRRTAGERWEAPFFWDIDEWSDRASAHHKLRLASPPFERAGRSWSLDFYPGGLRSREHCACYLRYLGDEPCVGLRFRLSVANRVGGPDVAWRSGFVGMGRAGLVDHRVFTNWGTAQLCPISWLDARGPGLVLGDKLRLRVDVMCLGKRDYVANPLAALSLDASAGTSDSSSVPIGSGAAARAATEATRSTPRANPLHPGDASPRSVSAALEEDELPREVSLELLAKCAEL